MTWPWPLPVDRETIDLGVNVDSDNVNADSSSADHVSAEVICHPSSGSIASSSLYGRQASFPSFSGVTRVGVTRYCNWCSGFTREGVTPILFLKKNWRHFLVITVCQFCGVTPIYFLQKTDDLFCSSLSLLLISLGCHPLEGITSHIFYLSDLVFPLFFVNFAHNFFLRVSPLPLKGVTRGGPPPPPSDATELMVS